MPVTTTTRAYELVDYNHKSIRQVERELREPGPAEVVVKMKAVSLNYRDHMIASGVYSRGLNLPMVPLSDGAGEVVHIGPQVKHLKKGDRVCPIFMQRWLVGTLDAEGANSALGGSIDGVCQEEIVLPENGLVKFPDYLSYEEAATLPCAAVTAWNAFFEKGNLQPGATVLLLGTGGVSIFGLQLAKAAGASVVITSSSDEKLERARKLGADLLVNYKQHPEWDKAVLSLVPNGVDHVLEVGGSGTLDRSIKSSKFGGHVSLIGVLAASGQFDTRKLLMKGICLQGIFVGSREMFVRMNAALNVCQIKPVIDRTFAVDQLSEALDYLSSGGHFGKIVLKF